MDLGLLWMNNSQQINISSLNSIETIVGKTFQKLLKNQQQEI